MLFNKDSSDTNILEDCWFEIFTYLSIPEKLNIIKTQVLKIIQKFQLGKHDREEDFYSILSEESNYKKFKSSDPKVDVLGGIESNNDEFCDLEQHD